MLASIIITIGKKSEQECKAGFEGGVIRDADFVEGPNDQRKEFFHFGDYFCVGPRSYGGFGTSDSLSIWLCQDG